MAAVHSRVEQRDAGWILVHRQDLHPSGHVAHPLSLLERSKTTEKEFCGERCLSDFCHEIEQIDGLLQCRACRACRNYHSAGECQVARLHDNFKSLRHVSECRVRLVRCFRPQAQLDLKDGDLILVRRRVLIRPQFRECSTPNRRDSLISLAFFGWGS